LGSGPLELSIVQGGFVGLFDFQLLIFPEATDGADVLIELGVTWAITFREGTVGLEAMFAADKCFAVSLAFFLFKLMRVQTRAGIPERFGFVRLPLYVFVEAAAVQAIVIAVD